jgi:hypothetical protein
VHHRDIFDPSGIMKARLLKQASLQKKLEAVKLKNSTGGYNG